MNHIWKFDEWKDLELHSVKDKILNISANSLRLGDLIVRDLCLLASSNKTPVGLYVFSDTREVLYAGKTHGRSLHERMISHIDHRDPIAGSPHLARLAQSLVKLGDALSGSEAVERILDMKTIWLPIPSSVCSHGNHKKFIAMVERRLLWHGCLDPKYNSPRVKRNDTFSIKGRRYDLTPATALGSVSLI